MDLIEEKELNLHQLRFKSCNPGENIPSNLGKKWTNEDENLLLEDLNNNIDIKIIAEKHNRTKGGIISRQKEIAYKMYIKNISIIEIINKTKLDESIINEYIQKKQYHNDMKQSIKKNKIEEKKFSIEDEIYDIKNDIDILKNTIKELVEMMKAVYEFEDS